MRVLITTVALLALSPEAFSQVKISQVHAQSSVYNRDYVELFNASSSPVNISGWWLDAYWSQHSRLTLSGVIPAHSYFLVSVASTGNGTAELPVAADLQGQLTLTPAHQRLDLFKPSYTEYGLIDTLAWYGQGQPGYALPMNGTNALLRAAAGCIDSRIRLWDYTYSQWDFDLAAPSPRNSSVSHTCAFVGPDCNRNGIDDRDEIISDPTLDCDGDWRLDSCGGYVGPFPDCDNNGAPDCAAIRDGAPDANWNRRVDTCEGGVLVSAPAAFTVQASGVSGDSSLWRAAGPQAASGPAFAVVRWDSAAIRAVISQYDGVPYIDLREVGLDGTAGPLDIFFTRNDAVVLTPGAAVPSYADLDTLFGDREVLNTIDYRPHAAGAELPLFLSGSTGCPAPQGSATSHLMNHIWSEPVTTIIVAAREPQAAAAFAGAANPSWPGPRLVFFMRPPSGCGSADFNGDGDVGTDSDIYAFFACLAGDCCVSCMCQDFNGDGDVGTDADIEAFFRVLAGSC